MGIALGAASVAVLSILSVPPAAAVGALGVICVAVGLVFTSRPLIELSGAVLGSALVVGGGFGAPPALVGIGTLAAVVAWDVSDHAYDLGQQIGREGRTRRNELVHLGGSLLVGGSAGAFAYGTFLGMAGGQPTTALSFLLCGALALIVWLR